MKRLILPLATILAMTALIFITPTDALSALGGTAPRLDKLVVKGNTTTATLTTTTSGLFGASGSANAASVIEGQSTTKGILFPRMTTTQRDNIASPPDGLVIYNTTTGTLNQRSASTWIAVGSGGAGGLFAGGQNALTNNSWESDTNNWTSTGTGTGCTGSTAYARNTAVANIIPPGVGSACFDAASTTPETLTSASVTVTDNDGLSLRTGVVSCSFKCASGTCTHTLTATDGSNNLATPVTITSSSEGFRRTSLTFPIPNSGSINAKISSASGVNEPVVYVDDCYLGLAENFNLAELSQASFYGSAKWVGVASCTWGTTGTSFADFSADSDCTSPTGSSLQGNASAPATKIPAVTFSNLPTGDYLILASFTAHDATGDGNGCHYRISDGSTAGPSTYMFSNTVASANRGVIDGRFSYSTAQSSKTFTVQAKSDAGTNTCNILNESADSRELEIKVYRFPTATELAVRPELNNWRLYGYITGSTNFDLGGSNVASFSDMTTSTVTLTTGTGSLAAKIACPTTEVAAGSSCATNESNGIVFDLPQAGLVEACVTFSSKHQMTGGSIEPHFVIAETSNSNAATILQTGTNVQSGLQWDNSGSNADLQGSTRLCEVFNFTSAGTKTLRVLYKQQGAAATVTNNIIWASDSALYTVYWDVKPARANIPTPLYVGSVTSNTTGVERVERANVTIAAGPTCTVNSESGDWLGTPTANSTSNCTLVINSGIFTAAPTCTANGYTTGAEVLAWIDSNTHTSTAVRVQLISSSGAAASGTFTILCMGPR